MKFTVNQVHPSKARRNDGERGGLAYGR
jgi:hypothetical protein